MMPNAELCRTGPENPRKRTALSPVSARVMGWTPPASYAAS